MVGHLLPNLDFREDGSEFWWGVFSVCLSLSVSLSLSSLSLSLSRVQREKQTNNSNNNNNGNNTKRERVTKEFVFSDVCLFSTFSEIPQKETRSTLSHHRPSALFLIFFFSSSSYPPFLKEESVSEAYYSLRVRTVSFYQKFRKHLRKRTGC